MNVHVSRHLKEELAWAIHKWLWVTSNKMLIVRSLSIKMGIKQIKAPKFIFELLWY